MMTTTITATSGGRASVSRLRRWLPRRSRSIPITLIPSPPATVIRPAGGVNDRAADGLSTIGPTMVDNDAGRPGLSTMQDGRDCQRCGHVVDATPRAG